MGTHPIFESDFDCLTELKMAYRSIQARLGVIRPCYYDPCFNIKAATEKAKGVVLFMHGLGDSGMGWAQIFAMQAARPEVRYLFPSANNIPVTLNMGMEMPSWFDIKQLAHEHAKNDDSRYCREGMNLAQSKINELIEQVLSEEGLTSKELVIAGFSQGGALAYHTALNHYDELAGICAMSSWLADDSTVLKPYLEGKPLPCPIQHHHGDSDPMVMMDSAVQSTKSLVDLTKGEKDKFEFFSYPGMEHTSCDKEMKNVDSFIGRVLNL